MSLLYPFSNFVRKLLIRKHLYFSCCASCGEISTPVENCLCTSLDIDFPIDALVWSPDRSVDKDAFARTVAFIRKRAPWIRSIIVLSDEPVAKGDSKLRIVGTGEFSENVSLENPRSWLLKLKGMAEQIVCFEAGVERTGPLFMANFFTPNAIPFLAAGRQRSFPDLKAAFLAEGLAFEEKFYPQTQIFAVSREDVADFEAFVQRLPPNFHEECDYFALMAHWMFSSARGVPRGDV